VLSFNTRLALVKLLVAVTVRSTCTEGARGGAVVRGTALQSRRWLVRLPTVILGPTHPLTGMSTRPVPRADNISTLIWQLFWSLGIL